MLHDTGLNLPYFSEHNNLIITHVTCKFVFSVTALAGGRSCIAQRGNLPCCRTYSFSPRTSSAILGVVQMCLLTSRLTSASVSLGAACRGAAFCTTTAGRQHIAPSPRGREDVNVPAKASIRFPNFKFVQYPRNSVLLPGKFFDRPLERT